jgi:hypothetical protein
MPQKSLHVQSSKGPSTCGLSSPRTPPSAYIRQEQDQNTRWLAEAKRLPLGEISDGHLAGLRQKTSVIEKQGHLVDEIFGLIGVGPRIDEKWGTIFDRFDAVGEAIEYRTTYAALCSQAHNDAEDLINALTIRATGDSAQERALQRETHAFSWFAVTLGLRHYARAAADIWKHFELLPEDLCQEIVASADLLSNNAAHQVRAASEL